MSSSNVVSEWSVGGDFGETEPRDEESSYCCRGGADLVMNPGEHLFNPWCLNVPKPRRIVTFDVDVKFGTKLRDTYSVVWTTRRASGGFLIGRKYALVSADGSKFESSCQSG
jgi:hypothetical protein